MAKASIESKQHRKELLNLAEFSHLFGPSVSLTYLLIRKGELPARKIGARTYILYDEAVEWARKLPLKAGASQRHRDQANRRWAGERAGGKLA